MAVKIAVLGGWNIPPQAMVPIIDGLGAQCQCPVTLLSYPGYDSDYSGSDAWQIDALIDLWASSIGADTLLVGWSLGGMIAIEIASRTRVAGVVTLASNSRFHGEPPCHMPTSVFRTFSRQIRKNYPEACLTFADLVLSGTKNLDQTLKEALLAAYRDFEPSIASINDSLALLGTLDTSNTLADCPQLRVFAEHDALVPVACAAQVPMNSQIEVHIVSDSHALAFSPTLWREIQSWRLDKMITSP